MAAVFAGLKWKSGRQTCVPALAPILRWLVMRAKAIISALSEVDAAESWVKVAVNGGEGWIAVSAGRLEDSCMLAISDDFNDDSGSDTVDDQNDDHGDDSGSDSIDDQNEDHGSDSIDDQNDDHGSDTADDQNDDHGSDTADDQNDDHGTVPNDDH